MRKKNSNYVITNQERIHYHLVVSKEIHGVIKYYAGKWRVTLTEATHRILEKSIKELMDYDNQ